MIVIIKILSAIILIKPLAKDLVVGCFTLLVLALVLGVLNSCRVHLAP
jgi:hypothetical protein